MTQGGLSDDETPEYHLGVLQKSLVLYNYRASEEECEAYDQDEE